MSCSVVFRPTHDAGAVGGIRRVKSAISVARRVLEHTKVTFLVGEQATQFAKDMGFQIESLSSNDSKAAYDAWRSNSCQPNYWVKVEPDANRYCGPYRPAVTGSSYKRREVSSENHDTIGIRALQTID